MNTMQDKHCCTTPAMSGKTIVRENCVYADVVRVYFVHCSRKFACLLIFYLMVLFWTCILFSSFGFCSSSRISFCPVIGDIFFFFFFFAISVR